MSKKAKKKIDQGTYLRTWFFNNFWKEFNDEDHEKKLEKLKEKLANISDEEEETKKLPKKNLFEMEDVQKAKKANKTR